MNIISRILLIFVAMIVYRQADADIKNCTLEYSKSVKEITMAAAKEANDCYIKDLSSYKKYADFHSNQTIVRVNSFCKKYQDAIANCVTRKPDEAILSCYMTAFQQILPNINKLERQFQLDFRIIYPYVVHANTSEEVCTVMALSNSDLKTSIALKTFNTCITENISANCKLSHKEEI